MLLGKGRHRRVPGEQQLARGGDLLLRAHFVALGRQKWNVLVWGVHQRAAHNMMSAAAAAAAARICGPEAWWLAKNVSTCWVIV